MSDDGRRTGMAQLTPRERDALTLLAQGHDAKSAARTLGISVHTLNDRLRDARRKLGTGTSREAARRLVQADLGTPDKSGPEDFGLVTAPDLPPIVTRPASRGAAARRLTVTIGGTLLMIFLTATAIAYWLSPAAETPRGDAPQVVETIPANGATIAAGAFDLIVRYDRPMQDGSMSYVQVAPDTFPSCSGTPRLDADRRTFVYRCRAEAGRPYEVWFNSNRYRNFRSEAGIPARPFHLSFSVLPADRRRGRPPGAGAG